MENFSQESIKAFYDHKRFPAIWHAILGCSFMQYTTIVPVIILQFIFGKNIGSFFTSNFGLSMFQGIISQFFAVLIIPILFILIFKKDMKATLRLKKSINTFQILLLLIASAGVFLGAQQLNAYVIEGLSSFMGEPSQTLGLPEATNLSQLIFELIIVAMLPAICEEIFFRGFVMRAFERYSPAGAVILSSIAFAVMHGNLQQVFYAFIIGLILGTVVMVSDSLLAGTVIHFAMNALSVIITYPPVMIYYIDFVYNNTLAYMLVSFIVLPLIAIFSISAFIKYSRKRNERLYGKAFVSEMNQVHLMPKQHSWETAVTVLGWVTFVFINFSSMIELWYKR